jgi:aryl-alcohol dehydrogenase-like predicted oxidoreductase
MEYRRLGSSGLKVSVLGLGTNQFGSEKIGLPEVNDILDASADLGINLIDTANAYTQGKSEELLGQALKGRWSDFIVATKFHFPVGDGPNQRGNSRYHIFEAVEASLVRLQTDHLDLYYIHRWDTETPIEETMRALDDLVRTGKVRYLGASAFAAYQLAHANLLAEFNRWTPLVVVQSHYHLLERDVEREVLPFCRDHQVGFIPYFPLAGGFLTGKYSPGQSAPAGSRGESSPYVQEYMTVKNFAILEQLKAWTEQRGRTLNQLAQVWLLGQTMVSSVITGMSSLEHFMENAKIIDWSLSEIEMAEVNLILTGNASAD